MTYKGRQGHTTPIGGYVVLLFPGDDRDRRRVPEKEEGRRGNRRVNDKRKRTPYKSTSSVNTETRPYERGDRKITNRND